MCERLWNRLLWKLHCFEFYWTFFSLFFPIASFEHINKQNPELFAPLKKKRKARVALRLGFTNTANVERRWLSACKKKKKLNEENRNIFLLLFKASAASPAGPLERLFFLSCAHLRWRGAQKGGAASAPAGETSFWGGERRGICKVGRKKSKRKKTETPRGRWSESKHLDEGPTARKAR